MLGFFGFYAPNKLKITNGLFRYNIEEGAGLLHISKHDGHRLAVTLEREDIIKLAQAMKITPEELKEKNKETTK